MTTYPPTAFPKSLIITDEGEIAQGAEDRWRNRLLSIPASGRWLFPKQRTGTKYRGVGLGMGP